MARFMPLSVAFAATFVSSMPAMADPLSPGVAPARLESPRQRNVYDPAQGIYFSPETNLWSWKENSAMQHSTQLPAKYQRFTSEGVTIVMAGNESFGNFAKQAA